MSEQRDDAALKTCPFCGSPAREECYYSAMNFLRAVCGRCGVATAWHTGACAKQRVIAAWNRRDGAGEEGAR